MPEKISVNREENMPSLNVFHSFYVSNNVVRE